MLRTPLWAPVLSDSQLLGEVQANSIPVMERHELAGSKLVALLARRASRDLFDAVQLLRMDGWDWERLRLAFLAHGAWNRKDWREVSLDDIGFDPVELRSNLLPVLNQGAAPGKADLRSWALDLVSECREGMRSFLPLPPEHLEFLNRLNDQGEIAPELVTQDAGMCALLRAHPMMNWKAVNVRQFRGSSRPEG